MDLKEVMDLILNVIQILMNFGSFVGEWLFYDRYLNVHVETLNTKMEILFGLEADINDQLGNVTYRHGWKQKREVKSWLRRVQRKKAEVQQIGKEVGKKRYLTRLTFLSDIEATIQAVNELLEQGQFNEGLMIQQSQHQGNAFLTTPLVGLTSAQKVLEEILVLLTKEDIKRIGIYGMGGIGKTTIVTHVHNKLLENVSTCGPIYWVTVSQESNLYKLQENIAKSIQLQLSNEEDERKRAALLSNALMKENKFVIILDDIWERFPLDSIGIPLTGHGRLIITTRSREVCQQMGCQKIIRLEPLSKDESWELFTEKIGHETMLSSEILEVAKLFSMECAGLPLSIITVASSMRGVVNLSEWRNALREWKQPNSEPNDMVARVFKALKFSYDRLRNERLQHCLLYCALFPEDYKIRKVDLIVYWIAEGLIDEVQTRQADFDRGYVVLTKLENACLLEIDRDYDGESFVKMHDAVRDMALNITGNNSLFMVKSGLQLMELPEKIEWSSKLLRVSLMCNRIGGQVPHISPNCPNLTTLFLQQNMRLYERESSENPNVMEISSLFFENMQNLRVLDLSWTDIECLPDSVSCLINLRALLLNSCRRLKYVPSLAHLKNLRELDMGYTEIEKVPEGMEQLINLKCLNLYNTLIGSNFPTGGLSRLSHLQCLRINNFNAADVVLSEIVSLERLEILGVNFSGVDRFNTYVKSCHWKRLNHYQFEIGSRSFMGLPVQITVNDKFFGRKLYIGGHSLNDLGSIMFPTNIQELVIANCLLPTTLPIVASDYQIDRELTRCRIVCCSGIEYFWSICPVKGSKKSQTEHLSILLNLQTLALHDLIDLRGLFEDGDGIGLPSSPKYGAFSNLKRLSVGHCPKLKFLFKSWLVQYYLQNLEVIHVYNCSEMEDIIASTEEHSYPALTFPRLHRMELTLLPNLKSIYGGEMVYHSLKEIRVLNCDELKKLPLSANITASKEFSELKEISGTKWWWDSLEWDHLDAKSVFQPIFSELHAADDDWITNSESINTANTIWRQDWELSEEVM